MTLYQAKDFLETAEGLRFAVVVDGEVQGRICCHLRYVQRDGVWCKLSTAQASEYLRRYHPDYLYHVEAIAAEVHGVSPEQVIRHFQPREMLRQRLAQQASDQVVSDLQALCGLFASHGFPLSSFGVTGSLLLGTQSADSDIDLICYQREIFHQARDWVQASIAQNTLQALDDADWLDAYRRRGCDFPFDDYVWHELRKYNKAMIQGRKFDLSLVTTTPIPTGGQARKLGFTRLKARIIDDVFAFDHPARWRIDSPDIDEVVCFTATYTGQARYDEQVMIAGQLEVDDSGSRRLVVGADREAIGEYIRVLR